MNPIFNQLGAPNPFAGMGMNPMSMNSGMNPGMNPMMGGGMPPNNNPAMMMMGNSMPPNMMGSGVGNQNFMGNPMNTNQPNFMGQPQAQPTQQQQN